MTSKVKPLGSIETTTISSLLMGNERQRTLQAKILGPEQTWTIVQLPARDVLNYRKLGSRTFNEIIQVIDERYWKFPIVEERAARVYVVLRPFTMMNGDYKKVVRSLLGSDVFDVYASGSTRELDGRQVTNVATRLQAGLA